jgi:CRISPR/Cas system-associated exonuclease Cas4 (RecB family)
MTYKTNLPRVSNIVSWVYPFDWEDKKRYKQWLKKEDIIEEEYLWWANTLWTFVHKQMENYILWKPIEIKNSMYEETKELIINWTKWLDDYWYNKIETELYLTDKIIQWTCDLLLFKWDKLILGDFKTYWIVKGRYWKPNKCAVDKHKRIKVQLQMSIYAYLYEKKTGKKITSLSLIFLHWEKTREYVLVPLEKEEIERIIKEFLKNIIYITF